MRCVRIISKGFLNTASNAMKTRKQSEPSFKPSLLKLRHFILLRYLNLRSILVSLPFHQSNPDPTGSGTVSESHDEGTSSTLAALSDVPHGSSAAPLEEGAKSEEDGSSEPAERFQHVSDREPCTQTDAASGPASDVSPTSFHV
jgi:hypothetical protein